MQQKIICSKCQRERPEKEFFKKRDGQRCDICKTCLTSNIDNGDPSTFLWILEKFDVPFVQERWVALSNQIYAKKGPAAFGSSSVIGTYLREMNMNQWKEYTFQDTEKLNMAEKERQRRLRLKEITDNGDAAALEESHENGEIDDFDYEHMKLDIGSNEPAGTEYLPGKMKGFDEAEIGASFTDEDRMMLIRKWGPYYLPSEWLKMEEMYQKYAKEYELNVDREETLKKMCRTSIQMDKAIDAGDPNGARNYSTMLDSLRKSAKFTEAQNKEDHVRYLDSVGELVRLAEREGGIIPQLVDPDDYPQDNIDYTLKDLKTYTRNLVVEELSLGDLIESYIAKLEKVEEEKEKEREMSEKTGSDPDEDEDYLTDEESEDWAAFVNSEIEKDAMFSEEEEE